MQVHRTTYVTLFPLTGSIVEAQEWEYKLIAVQDWLQDRGVMLSSHLEHEMTAENLPDEEQVRTAPVVDVRFPFGLFNLILHFEPRLDFWMVELTRDFSLPLNLTMPSVAQLNWEYLERGE